MTPEALARLHAACFDLPPPWPARDFAQMLAAPTCFLKCAYHEDHLSAFALFRVVADEAELLTLATAPEARRKGHARALMQDGLAEAMRRGARMCFLEVAAPNHAARRLYDTLGFRIAGTRKGYYHGQGAPVDAIVYRADLTA